MRLVIICSEYSEEEQQWGRTVWVGAPGNIEPIVNFSAKYIIGI